MNIFDILLICMGLSMDNLAVAIAGSCGTNKFSIKTDIKVSLIFCLTGLICLLLGWFGGVHLEVYISAWDHWASFFILGYIGGKMILTFLKSPKLNYCSYDITKTKTLIILALATNIDVFAIGLTLAFYKVNLALVISILTVSIIFFTMIGFFAGKKVGFALGRKAELLGGAILILIGLKILIQGLIAG